MKGSGMRTSQSLTCRSLCLFAAGILAVAILSGCAGKTAPAAPIASSVKRQPATPKAAQVIRTANVLVGYPYKWGGYSPDSGFDCSGLVWFVYRQNGVNLPRISWQQFNAGSFVERNDIRPGDLVFYNVEKKGKSLHVGIVTDRGTFIHSPSSGKRVMESSLDQSYWRQHYIGARRVI